MTPINTDKATGTVPSIRRRSTGATGTKKRAATIGVLVLIFVLTAPLLAPQNPDAIDLSAVEAGPSSVHLLGADGVGRDILSRLLSAAPTSLAAPMLVVLLSLTIGIAFALLAVWFPKAIGTTLTRVMDILLAFPSILLAIAVVAVAGKGLGAIIPAISVAYAPYVFRLIRAEMLQMMGEDYIAVLSVQGMSRTWMSFRHLLPNMSRTISAQATINFGYAMGDLAALSFLGLGTQPPNADWGSMVASGLTSILNGAPYEALAAGAAIVLVIVLSVRLGDKIVRHESGSWTR